MAYKNSSVVTIDRTMWWSPVVGWEGQRQQLTSIWGATSFLNSFFNLAQQQECILKVLFQGFTMQGLVVYVHDFLLTIHSPSLVMKE